MKLWRERNQNEPLQGEREGEQKMYFWRREREGKQNMNFWREREREGKQKMNFWRERENRNEPLERERVRKQK